MKRLERPGTQFDIKIGAEIRRHRKAAKLSQKDIAGVLLPPVTYQQVYKYERGVDRISAVNLYRVAAACKVPVCVLMSALGR